jgi:hypothetical protein
MHTLHFLLVLTLIQFWWIAIWGIAYIVIDAISGPSKITELWIYAGMLVFTVVVIHMNPDMLEKL